MKKLILVTLFLASQYFSFAQDSLIIRGVVKDDSQNPIVNCIVKNVATNKTTKTNQRGEFVIAAKIGDDLLFTLVGFLGSTVKIVDANYIEVNLSENTRLGEVVVSGNSPSLSMKNFWTGAKVGYNFTSSSDDNFFVGSASINLNLLNSSNEKNTFGIVGNIGNFKFNKDTTDSKNIQKLSQSINGLSVGIGYTNQTSIRGGNAGNNKEPVISYFRKFIISGYRLNTFKNVGIDSSTINFNQSFTTAGLEYEQTGFRNGGSLTASIGLTMLLFDKQQNKTIFNIDKGSRLIVDMTVILPLSKTMGFFINGTFAQKTEGIFIAGIVFKP